MRKCLILFFYFINSVFASPIQDHRIDPAELSSLTLALGIPKEVNILIETQKRWLRKSDQERWEVAELLSDQKRLVLNWAAKQGLFDSWKPLYATYDKALILGATTSSMQKRLNYLKQLWDEGVRFSEIIWLTGDRPLNALVDSLTDRCITESDAARILWEETSLPKDMRSLPVVFIAVPMKKEGPLLKRANTEDTLITWLNTSSIPCQALFISDQPFCGYQFAVIKRILPEAFEFDLVGPGVDPAGHPAAGAILLDSIARWLYQDSLTNSP